MKAVRKPRRKTNVQVLKDIMEFSDYGALVQGYVIDALMKHSSKVIAANLVGWGSDSFVSPEAWKGCAQEVLGKLKAHLGEA